MIQEFISAHCLNTIILFKLLLKSYFKMWAYLSKYSFIELSHKIMPS